jgi:hypothetical protein
MKTVIEMAREAGIVGNFWPELERFAELVRADEREACAKSCESFQQDPYEELLYKSDFAAAIRARSNT